MARIGFASSHSISDQARTAYCALEAQGGLTNMQKALLVDYRTFLAYRAWHESWESLVDALGITDATIFAHAISRTGSCLLCSLFFVSDLRGLGIDPNDFKPDARQQVLIDFAQSIVLDPTNVSDELFERVRKHFDEHAIVVLVGFAGQMIAGNTFNSVLHIDVDGRLQSLQANYAPTPRATPKEQA
jgi:alkylhydroperoxidase family enzyme